MMQRHRWTLRTLALVCLVALASCGGDGATEQGQDAARPGTEDGGTQGSQAADSQPEDLITVRSTSLPLLDNGPYFYAIEQGLFEEHGINIEDVTSSGGALGIPALIGGDVDLVFSNTISALLAAAEGLPVKIVAATNLNLTEEESPEDFVAIVAGPESGITDPSELEGKRMAVNTLNNINWLYERAWLREQGVDPETVEFLEIPFPEQVPALLEGRVDATMIGAPFLQQLLEEGSNVLGYPYRVSDAVLVATYVTSESYAESNPEVISGFRQALEEANEAVQDPANRDEVLAIFEETTRIERSVLEQVTLPQYEATPDPDIIRDMAELMIDEGLIDEVPDLDSLILNP